MENLRVFSDSLRSVLPRRYSRQASTDDTFDRAQFSSTSPHVHQHSRLKSKDSFGDIGFRSASPDKNFHNSSSSASDGAGAITIKPSLTKEVDPLAELLHQLEHLNLTGRVAHENEATSIGGYADVFVGKLSSAPTRRNVIAIGRRLESEVFTAVAIKRFRLHLNKKQEFARTIARELRVWSRLKHRNVLQLLGYTLEGGFPALVSEWMHKGTLRTYLNERMPGMEEMLYLVEGVAFGLAYLHDNGVVHSDLKSDNVFISPDGVPLLADFGVSRLLVESRTLTGTSELRGSMRWMAIELFGTRLEPGPVLMPVDASAVTCSDYVLHTKASDIWSFGMVVYEIITGKLPYVHIPTDVQVMLAIVTKELPQPPASLTADGSIAKLWHLCTTCWNMSPSLRPKVAEICISLARMQTAEVSLASVIDTKANVTAIAVSPDSRHIVAATVDMSICVWIPMDSHSQCVSRSMSRSLSKVHKGRIGTLAYSPDGLRIATGSEDGTVCIINAAKWRIVHRLRHPNWVTAVSFSSNAILTTASGDRTVHFWNVESGGVVQPPVLLPYQMGPAGALSCSPDGLHMLVGSAGGRVHLHDVRNGQLVHSFDSGWTEWGRDGSICCIAYSRDGETAVSAAMDGTLRVYDMSAQRLAIRPLSAHTAQVNAVAFSPDGRFILTAADDQSVGIWNAVTGESVQSVTGHEGHALACFSPNGQIFASTSDSGSMYLWNFLKRIG